MEDVKEEVKALLLELVANAPYMDNDFGDPSACYFCAGGESDQTGVYPHLSDCLIVRAEALAKKL